jgi:hypothetical protein
MKCYQYRSSTSSPSSSTSEVVEEFHVMSRQHKTAMEGKVPPDDGADADNGT